MGRGGGRGGGKGEDGKSEDGATGDGGERVMDGGVTGEANANTNNATLSYPFVLHQSHLCEMMLRLSKAETERSLKCAGLWTLSGLLQQEMATVNNGSFHVEDHTKACDALTLPMVMSVSSLRVRLLRYCETQVCESIIFYTPFIHPLYTLYSRICTYGHPLYMYIHHIYTSNTSKHLIYALYTPYIRLETTY